MPTILIIDDEADIRALVSLMLQDAGYTVHEAGNGTDGLAQLKENDINLVIIDVMLPDVSGWEVCRRIKETSTLPVIIFTVRSQVYDEARLASVHPDAFINKPFERIELLETVARLLA
ncbi:MAG: Transcriptional regulatory protein AfsQ1 [bacterium ADurb.Bin429]|nr:MAG: Transcriptional regulatory protein AfsQ1 [bacterium ADurb.Bin429]